MANSYPASGLAYVDALSVGTSAAAASSLYVCSSCVQATRIEHTYSQTNLHHNTLWLRAMNSGAKAAASIGFTVVNNGGDHHRANIEATANSGQVGGNLALYTRNNNGNDTLGYYQDHAGNVGIGTASPTDNFHVAASEVGNVGISIQNTNANYSSQLRFLNASGAECSAITYVQSSNFLAINVAGGNRLNITNTGNVGIGIESPSVKLHICDANAGGTDDMIRLTQGNVNNHAYIRSERCNGALVLMGSTRNSFDGCIPSDSGIFWSFCNNPLIIGTCNRERVRFTTNGNVGIGTSSPETRLQVTDTINFANATFNARSDGGYLTFQEAGTTRAYLQWGLTVSGGSGGCSLLLTNDESGGSIALQTKTNAGVTNGCALVIANTGNVGIDTPSPSYKLYVNGTFYAAGSSIDYKESICDYDTNSCLFMCLKPKTYQYKDEWKHLGKELKSETQIGLIAEEVAEVMPELAVLVNENDNKVVRNVDYEKLSIVLLSEVQKLRTEIDQLKNIYTKQQ